MNVPKKNTTDRQYMMFALKIIGDFGATIAVPVVVFVLVGQRLDSRFETSPWFTIAAFALAALVSGRMIYTKAKVYGKEYESIDKADKQ